jgi:hypothetical protein
MKSRIHRVPRIWSNIELQKFGYLFTGDIVNVSAWTDVDKNGSHYSKYFPNKSSYTITNYSAEKRGFQGFPGEIFLDLEKDLPEDLLHKFDVVFNHTTLEHVYDFKKAFRNLCNMSKDVLIIVVPFVQQMHGNYGDFWRFSPESIDRMITEEGLTTAYLSFNNNKFSSVYVFAIAVRNKTKWRDTFSFNIDYVDKEYKHLPEPYAGCNAIIDPWHISIRDKFVKKIKGLI